MFENMAMINKIANYGERNVNDSWVGLAGAFTPIGNAQTAAIGVDKWHAVHENTFGESPAWHVCLIKLR